MVVTVTQTSNSPKEFTSSSRTIHHRLKTRSSSRLILLLNYAHGAGRMPIRKGCDRRNMGKIRNDLCAIFVMLLVLVGIAFTQTVPRSPEDCLPYNANRLAIHDEGERGWLLSDDGGKHRMAMFDNESDAALGLEIARQHNQMCFIGRNNRRQNRKTYILQYWK
jgi:hypothetical protein